MSKKIFIILTAILLIVLGFLFFNFRKLREVRAGSTDNVSGWAWSENIGWISFNCTNTNWCATSSYGVNINPTTGNFSGFAWSDRIGWIKFEAPLKIATEDYPTCPPSTCPTGSPNYPARLDSATGRVTGWARACSGTVNGDCNSATRTDGWDGWILLGPIVKGATDYGVWIETGTTTKPFHNWAWGSDVIGWISFNCLNENWCATSTYKVITTLSFPPYVESGSQTTTQTHCNVFAGQSRVDFQWIYRDPDLDPETQFDFRVNDVNNVNDPSPEVDRSFSGLNNPDGTVNTQTVIVKTPFESDKITFGTTYYWWVRVYDNQGNNSGWVAGPSFTTPAHAYPWPDFTPFPSRPFIGEVVTFEQDGPPPTGAPEALCYSGAAPLCQNDPNASYQWDFDQNVNPGFDSTYKGNATTTYANVGSYTVVLRITDNTLPPPNNYCETSRTLGTTLPLPKWKEIPPH